MKAVVQSGRFSKVIEIKSAATFSMRHLGGIRPFKSITDKVESSYFIYTGEAHSRSDSLFAVYFASVESIL